jgi:uncharacterized protein with PIN domain
MKFICDAMLGKLAKYLRILGFSAEYTNDGRILHHYKDQPDAPYFLTRTTKKIVYERIIFIQSDMVREQLREIKEIIHPYIDPDEIMNRCIECNIKLMDVQKQHIEQKVPEFVFHQYGQFRECPQCGKVYWEGSHTTGMTELVREIMAPEGGKSEDNTL